MLASDSAEPDSVMSSSCSIPTDANGAWLDAGAGHNNIMPQRQARIANKRFVTTPFCIQAPARIDYEIGCWLFRVQRGGKYRKKGGGNYPSRSIFHRLGARMDKFEIDSELHAMLSGIRESMRMLFEQLRLRDQDGDISGKERLERVPALAKRNFTNLTGPVPHLAVKEAWRLVDFLEGNGLEARLSIRAREALRAIELNKQVAAFRASDFWKEAALRLRRALSATPDESRLTDGASTVVARRPRPALNWIIGMAVPIAMTALIVNWWVGRPGTSSDPRTACLALEDASASELAAHWDLEPGAPNPRPPASADAQSRVYPISDPPDGGLVRSIWTTSVFSYAERATRPGPGGGRSDFRLRVGGWGDTYLSLLRVPVPTNRLVQRAVIQLTVLGDEAVSRPTTMTLRAIHDSWQVRPGPNNRLWWQDCPRSAVVRKHLPPPGPRDSVYEIEITDLYNAWALGLQAPYGILLEPENIGRWGPDRPRYSNFNTFYSTRAVDPANRPRLILTY